MLKVLVADDHEIVLRGIRQILTEEFPFIEIAEAYDTASLLEKVMTDNWDIIISDLSMPGGGGLEAIPQIIEKKPEQRILIISIYPEEQYAFRAIRLGAYGFLNKDTAPDELIKAVNTILSGRRYINPELATRMTGSKLKKAGLLPHELLSDREFQVMLKLATGISISDIATQLNVSANTISTYRIRILEKMNMKNNADLIRYVLENKLI